RKLELELNTPLFNRHPRGMSLTPEGKKLIAYSEKILSISNEMKKVLKNKKEPTEELKISTVETFIKLRYILSAFNQKYRYVELLLLTGETEKLQEEVLNHRLDGAFNTETGSHPDLVSHDVFQEELVLISDVKTTSLEQANEKPFLCFSEGCGYRTKFETWYE